ncbi:MAG: Gfo/Idh/MocA family oxidoreductase [Opitutales bacterium]|nr:Gfo/Idh/MocA family oxidoreductase [Opitutales bacterium]
MLKRREFIKGTTALSSLMFLPSCQTQKVFGANDKLNVALVGVGGIGHQAINNFEKDMRAVNLVAFCDVMDDTPIKPWSGYKSAAVVYKKYPNVARFRDYRVMLDKMDKQIDAVVISTPDHMHYPIAAWAIAKGKHVFCQKPLTRTIWEANELKRLAKEAGVITQMGNQGHTNEGWRLIREWYDAGIIGQIKDIYMWTNRPIWPQGGLQYPEPEKIPSELDYNLWLGVAPYTPYSSKVVPFNWRGLRNFGTGAAGDMACHFFDVPYSAFNLGCPSRIKGWSTPFTDYDWPAESKVEMLFNNPCGLDGKIRVHWSDANKRPKAIERVDPEILKAESRDTWKNANWTFIVGTKETIITNEYGLNTMVYPRSRMRDLLKANALPKKSIPRSKYEGNAHLEWAYACKEGKNPPGNFDYAAPFTEMCLLSMISINFPNQELAYSPRKMEFINCPEANAHIRSLYDYRSEFLPSKVML